MCVPNPRPRSRSAIYRGGRRRRHWRNLGMQHDIRTTPDTSDGKLTFDDINL